MFKKVFILILTVVFITSSLTFSVMGGDGDNTVVGAWYSTWYAKTLTQTWINGHGNGSFNQLSADVSGDGKADAVVFFSTGDWYVSLSTGTNFANYSLWKSGHGSGSANQLLGDVNGDGKADAVTFSSTGEWKVALSNGSGFGTPTTWITGYGSSSSKQLLADASGDGKADAVVYFSNGDWYVAISSGSAFGSGSRWISAYGSSSTLPLMGDVNGDGKADAVTYLSGQWKAALSSGSAFNTSTTWISGHGSGSASQMLGDVNGDRKADAVVYFSSGDWYISESSGSSFNAYYQKWKAYAPNSNKQFLSDTYGHGWASYTAFYSSGEWQSRCNMFNMYNTWEAWNIKYVPYTLGTYQTYDSGNAAVIDEHLAMMSQAGIDFILLDETNNLYVDNGYIFNRAKAVASRIRVWNSNPSNRPIKYAIAIGGIQFNNNPQSLEYEAGEVWTQFVNTQDGGTANYFYLNGKPLLVTYCTPTNKNTWTSWSGDKTNSNRFSTRWAHSPAEAGTYGWEARNGTIDHNEVMLVMPGWNNNKGVTPVSRSNGDFYSLSCWDKVIKKSPRPSVVIINSFNEYAEETSVAPTDTSNVISPTEKWYNKSGQIDNFMYWNMTKEYIRQMKGWTASVGFSSTNGNYQWYYQQWNGSAYSNMTWDSANSRWTGSQPYCLVMSNKQHPDTNDSVRKWLAPSTGTVTIKGTVKKEAVGGDGVSVKIMKNGTVIWGPTDIAYNNTTGINHNISVSVNQGDSIYFIVNKKSDNSYDSTVWDPSIFY